MKIKANTPAADRTVGTPAEPAVVRASPSTPPSAIEAPPTYTSLAALVAQVGEATLPEAMTLLGDPSPDALIEAGRLVATPRIADDALRILGTATTFYRENQTLSNVVRLSPEVVRIGAWCALQAQRSHDALTRQKAARGSQGRAHDDNANESESNARTARDQLAEVVTNVAGNDAQMLRSIETALQPAAHGLADTSVAGSLAALVAVGRGQLASEDAKVKARCALYRLTAAWLDACDAQAKKSVAARAVVAVPVKDATAQASVDVWDGLSLLLLDRVVRAFATAHAADARVPKLGYVSLRARRADKAKKPAKTPRGGDGNSGNVD